MTFESMWQKNTNSSRQSAPAAEPTTKRTRAPKGHVTINGKVYREATGFYADRCPGSSKRITWTRVRSNLGSNRYQCTFCGAWIEAEYGAAILDTWTYPVHDRPSGPIEYQEAGSLPDEPEF